MRNEHHRLENIEPRSAAEKAGRLIKLLRKEEKLTQAELGTRMGLTQPRVAQLEKGEGPHGPSIGTLSKAAAACGYLLRIEFVPNR